jgi:hypothetical protein
MPVFRGILDTEARPCFNGGMRNEIKSQSRETEAWTIQVIDEGGLGQILAAVVAKSAAEALMTWAAGRPLDLTEFADVNRDGTCWEAVDWATGERLQVSK